jgi:putative ABC transport system permease protein
MIRHVLRLLRQRRREYRLLVTQMVFTFLILTTAAVHIGTIRRSAGPEGFDAGGLLVLAAGPEAEEPALAARLWQVARSTPGVAAAARTTVPPFGEGVRACFSVRGRCVMAVDVRVSPSFREVMGLRMVSGRWLDPAVCSGTVREAVVTPDVAGKVGGGGVGASLDLAGTSYQVVGVVETIRLTARIDKPAPLVFTPVGLAHGGCDGNEGATLLRLAGADVRRRLVDRLDAAVGGAVYDLGGPQETINATGTLLTWLGLALCLLAAVTLTGVVWRDVERRRTELGLRRALGATAGAVRRQVLLEMAVLAGKASVIGTIVLAHIVFFRITFPSFEPLAWDERLASVAQWLAVCPVGLAALLVLVLGVAWLPSRLALRIAPMEALRDE